MLVCLSRSRVVCVRATHACLNDGMWLGWVLAKRTQMEGRINRANCERVHRDYYVAMSGLTTVMYAPLFVIVVIRLLRL